jgi:hypothetical protein
MKEFAEHLQNKEFGSLAKNGIHEMLTRRLSICITVMPSKLFHFFF